MIPSLLPPHTPHIYNTTTHLCFVHTFPPALTPNIVPPPPSEPSSLHCLSLPLIPSLLSRTGTLLHRADLWHAPAPSLPRPGLHGLLLGFCILLVRPIQVLLQITPGASQGAPEELTCAELAAESVEREALAALLLLKGLLHFFGRIALVHKVV